MWNGGSEKGEIERDEANRGLIMWHARAADLMVFLIRWFSFNSFTNRKELELIEFVDRIVSASFTWTQRDTDEDRGDPRRFTFSWLEVVQKLDVEDSKGVRDAIGCESEETNRNVRIMEIKKAVNNVIKILDYRLESMEKTALHSWDFKMMKLNLIILTKGKKIKCFKRLHSFERETF